MAYMASSVLKKSFKTTMIVKGVDGVLQVLGGLLLSCLKPGTMHHAVVLLTQHELSDDPRDWIALHLLSAIQRLGDTKTFAAFYLVTQGFIKILLAVLLLRGALWAYPVMIGYALLFMAYQLYRYRLSRAFGWLLLIGFDACVVWLTWHEYRRKHIDRSRPRAVVRGRQKGRA